MVIFNAKFKRMSATRKIFNKIMQLGVDQMAIPNSNNFLHFNAINPDRLDGQWYLQSTFNTIYPSQIANKIFGIFYYLTLEFRSRGLHAKYIIMK